MYETGYQHFLVDFSPQLKVWFMLCLAGQWHINWFLKCFLVKPSDLCSSTFTVWMRNAHLSVSVLFIQQKYVYQSLILTILLLLFVYIWFIGFSPPGIFKEWNFHFYNSIVLITVYKFGRGRVNTFYFLR